jgi:WD40-like Beta Propeller Repeat
MSGRGSWRRERPRVGGAVSSRGSVRRPAARATLAVRGGPARHRAARGVAALVALAGLATAAAAPAYVAPGATIVSASLQRLEQGDDASTAPDISADGRYVVFKTLARNLFPDDLTDPAGAFYEGGIFRRDMATGRLELVALGNTREQLGGALLVRGAENPSVSADGRWVAFSTGERLAAVDDNDQIDVYVRDMTLPLTAAAAFELVSARDGAAAPARYGRRTPDLPFRNPGADVSPGAAISDDGRRVVFVTPEVASDLPASAAVDVAPGQVFVRDREARRTELVTRIANADPPAPAGGAERAVISGDGSTVAWPGRNASQQARFLPGENPDPARYYYLWRRIADGPAAPTRRITGAADVDDPACGGVYEPSASATGPCYGPLADTEHALAPIADTPPALSADGRRVAFLTGAPPRPSSAGVAHDVYVTSMAPGVSRKAGTVELTREGTGRDPVDSAPVTAIALSPDGRHLAVVTERTRFLLPALRLVTGVRAVPGLGELYLADLATGTLERAVRAFDGGDAGDGVAPAVALSVRGRRVAFASGAENLFFGDGNQRPDVFVVDRLDAAPPQPEVAEPPQEPPAAIVDEPPARVRRLRVSVRRAPAGSVRLRVRAPAAGRLTAAARGRLPRAGSRVRLLGRARRAVRRRGPVTITIRLARRHRAALRRAGRLEARVRVTLVPRAGTPLRREVAVRFHAPPRRRTDVS